MARGLKRPISQVKTETNGKRYVGRFSPSCGPFWTWTVDRCGSWAVFGHFPIHLSLYSVIEPICRIIVISVQLAPLQCI